MDSNSVVRNEQRQLLQRLEQLVRLIKRDMRYGGSKDTGDLGSAVCEKLLRSPTLRQKFDAEPRSLRGLLRTMVRQVLIDEIRRRGGLKRLAPEREQLRTEWLQQCGRPACHKTPELEHKAQQRHDVKRVMRELERFSRGEDHSRIDGERRKRMHEALLLHWQGFSHAEIATRLGMKKATVGHSIDALSVMLARRIVTATEARSEDARGAGPAATHTRATALLDATSA